VSDGAILKAPNGNTVLAYKTQKPPGLTSPSAAYFDPINSPSGVRVTNVAPDDHPFHRGMFLAFIDSEFVPNSTTRDAGSNPPEVDRADFWGWGHYAPTEGRVIKNVGVELLEANGQHAKLEIRNQWLIGTKHVLDETDIVIVSQQKGAYVVDSFYKLAPLEEFRIKQEAFGGFAVQGPKDGHSTFSGPGGEIKLPSPHFDDVNSDWPSSEWYDFSFSRANGKEAAGFAVMDHPLNPPTRWHNTLWFLNPCIATFGDLTIHPAAPLVLRYRVVVHDGSPSAQMMNELSREWKAMSALPFTAK
jgi:hypothetical protein